MPQVDHFGASVLDDPPDDVDGGIVPIEQRGGGNDADPSISSGQVLVLGLVGRGWTKLSDLGANAAADSGSCGPRVSSAYLPPMARIPALFLLSIITINAEAQSWCPPGATWTYEYNLALGGYYGVQRVEYVEDTLLGGYTAQRLEQTDVVAPSGTTDFQSYPSFSLFTRYDSEAVFIWDNNSTYDTLFWFGAAPGDRWNAAGWPDGGNIALTVLDTSTEVIDGVPLRRLVVEPFPGLPIDTVYERIGGLQLLVNAFLWFVSDAPYEGLLCYRDQDIDHAAYGVTDCGYTLSVPDDRRSLDASPFPNPGTTLFALDLPRGQHTITLFDATGREVLNARVDGPNALIRTDHLPSGMFTVRVDRGQPMRWSKE